MVADVSKPATWPLFERALRRHHKPDPMRRRSLCRDLFGLDRAASERYLRQQNDKRLDDMSAKYNFDFRTDTPIDSGRYQWYAVEELTTCPVLKSQIDISNAEEAKDSTAGESSATPAAASTRPPALECSAVACQAKITGSYFFSS